MICKAAAGEKYKKAHDWKIPAVSIKWINEAMFGEENVTTRLSDPRFKLFKPESEALRISKKLVSQFLEPWNKRIGISKDTFYQYKERLAAESSKRSLTDSDQGMSSSITPEKKRIKLDPKSLFVKVKYKSYLREGTWEIMFFFRRVFNLRNLMIQMK